VKILYRAVVDVCVDINQ